MRISNVLRRLKRLSFRSKLLLSYGLLVTIPLLIISSKYYYSSNEFVAEFARQNLYSIVKQNNEIIDAEFSRIEESSLAMIADQALYEQYLNADPSDEYNMSIMEKSVNQALNKYFPEMNHMFSYHLVTSYASIGTSSFVNTGTSSIIPYEIFDQTELYQAAIKGDGAMKWMPTYSYNQMFVEDSVNSKPMEYSQLLSGVRLLKLFKVNNGDVKELEGNGEVPVLLISYTPDLYGSRFISTIPQDGASFFVASRNGELVSGNYKYHEEASKTPEWFDEIVNMKSGTLTVMQDGKPLIVCFDTSLVTGWISAITIAPDKLMSSFLPEIEHYTLYLAMLLLLIALVLAYFFANSITQPIHQLLKAIKKTGEGEFDTQIPVESYNEMGFLIHKYNQMNVKINNLIEENYIVRLREKETKIMSLNIQLNPHFLYNTLNIMNWTALESDQKELSRMIVSLSSMLQYTSENDQETGDFKKDFQWIENYIYITDQRFEGKFVVNYDIAQELYKTSVPKLFLQPFIENAIVHGFAHIHFGGVIKIRGWIEGEERIFTVEDNGIGIPEDKIEKLHKTQNESIGIQNVDKRIKLIYGDSYGVSLKSIENKGTVVKIKLPL